MSVVSTDFVLNQSLGDDSSLITVDIKFELPNHNHQPVQSLEDVVEDNGEDLESWMEDESGGSANADITADYGIGEPPVPELLKDPLDLGEQVSVAEMEFKPEVKFTNINDDTTAKKSGSSSTTVPHIRYTKPKLKKIKTAICTTCNLGFPSPFLFEQHMIQIHQDDRPYPCKFCGKPFAESNQLLRHETIHNPKRFQGEPQFPCDICGKKYHLKVSMEGHKKKSHLGYKPPHRKSTAPVKQHHSTSGVKNPNPYRKPKEVHPCPHCDLTFEMKCMLQKHMLCHTKERAFSCPICQQPFPRQTQVKSHIRKVHHSATPSGFSHPRPKWQANQPCPCTTCGKIFPNPSTLKTHMLLHTGEKPHCCLKCGEKFRMKQTLNHHIKRNHIQDKLQTNPLKLYKCRICGRDDFLLFADLNNHRLRCHRHIPFDSEKEKPFGCGICGKPWYLREGALICALIGHDPTSLRKQMFKNKCSECPDHFGFHNLTFLRRHWDEVHQDKQLPVQFRVGMYLDNLKAEELPSCIIDKKKRDDIKLNGPPSELVKSEFPLFTEFDLLDIPEEERFFRKGEHEIVYGYKFQCGICGYRANTKQGLGKHTENRHGEGKGDWKRKASVEHICGICGVKLARAGNLKRHVETMHDPSRQTVRKKIGKVVTEGIRRRVGRPRKVETENGRVETMTMDMDVIVKTEPIEENGSLLSENFDCEDEARRLSSSSMFKCRFCGKRFQKIQPLRMHELRMHVKPWSTSKYKKCGDVEGSSVRNEGKEREGGGDVGGNVGKVNICDTKGVQAILNFQSVKVKLTRLVGSAEGGESEEGDNEGEMEQVETVLLEEISDCNEGNGIGGDESRDEDEAFRKRWEHCLGNKHVRIVLDRVDKQIL